MATDKLHQIKIKNQIGIHKKDNLNFFKTCPNHDHEIIIRIGQTLNTKLAFNVPRSKNGKLKTLYINARKEPIMNIKIK